MNHRTRAYWPTRILLAVGFVATAIAVLAAPGLLEPCFGCTNEPVLGIVPARVATVVLVVSGIVVAVFGLVWMVRIFRGPRDEPSDWRYRDR